MCTRTRWPAPTTGLSEFEQRALALLSIKCPGLLDEVGPGTVGRVQIQIQIMLQQINRHEAGLCCNMKGYSDNRTFQSKHLDTPRGAHGVTVFFAAARLIYPPAYQRHCTCCVKQLSPPSSGIFFVSTITVRTLREEHQWGVRGLLMGMRMEGWRREHRVSADARVSSLMPQLSAQMTPLPWVLPHSSMTGNALIPGRQS